MRWYGVVGYGITKKVKPGIFENEIEEHEYVGDVITRTVNVRDKNEIVDDINVNMSIEIIADPFAYDNFMHIKYVEHMGQKWKVTAINPNDYPRLKLTIGGLYED